MKSFSLAACLFLALIASASESGQKAPELIAPIFANRKFVTKETR